MPQIGTVSALVGGSMELTMPTKVGFWYIQNQSVEPLKLTFEADSEFGRFSSIILAPAVAAGGPGGYIDSVAFPFFGKIVATSVDLTAPFGSGAGARLPVNNIPWPGNALQTGAAQSS